MRRINVSDWSIGVEHFAERFGLFIILVLGESIVLTGATTSGEDLTPARILAFVVAFLTTAAIWWLYFTQVATIGERYLETSEDRTRLAVDVYTYLHVLFTAGIILSAVGDELVIAHPTDVLPPYEVAAVAAGPAIYLLATAIFGYRLTGSVTPVKLLGVLACMAIGLVGLVVPALVLATLLVAVLVAVAVVTAVRPPSGATAAPASPRRTQIEVPGRD